MGACALTCALLTVLQVVGGHTFHRRTLDNGLQALAVDDGQRERVSVFVVYAVGNRAETAATTGLAHLCEHAMYTGTATTPAGKHDAAIQALGGESNAYTRDDYTAYYDHQVPASALEQVLRLEADRMRGLTWAEPAFLHERQRLTVEERHSNDPQVQLAARRDHEVWRGSGYGAGVLDERGNTRGPELSLETVRAFWETWYHPRNAAVVVVGGDPAAALDAIARAFGGLPAGPAPPALPGAAEGELPREVTLEAPLSRERVEWVWTGPALAETDQRLALRLLAELFAQRTAPDGSPIEVVAGDRAGPDLFLLAATGPGADAAVRATWGELLGGAWDEARLGEAKRRIVDELEKKPLRSRPYFSLAVDVAVLTALGQPDLPGTLATRVQALTRADLLRAAETWLPAARRITLRWQATGPAAAPLPEDKPGLKAAAEAAEASGDLPRAIAAYERLLTLQPGRIDLVIYRYQLGALHRQRGELTRAREHLLAALEVVEYPAVRELLNEVEAELAKGGEGKPATTPPPAHPSARHPSSEPGEQPPPPAAPPHPAHPSPAKRVVVQGGELPPEWASEAEQVLADLERWRGLTFLRPVVVEVLPEDPEGPAGWYEPGKGRLVVTRKGSAKFGRGVMLHELFHALQDQHYDLSAAHERARGSDQERALQALIEGEAMLAVQELMAYDFSRHAHIPEGPLDEERYQKLFHYGAGLQFVLALRDARGWAGVSAAFKALPSGTAEVFHPQRYLRRTGAGAESLAPPPAPTVDLDAAGQPLPERAEGEYGLRVLVARDPALRPQHEALGAALTHDLHRRARLADGRVRHAWALRFRSAEEAAAFHALARQALRAVPGLVAGSESLEGAEETVTLRWTGPAEE